MRVSRDARFDRERAEFALRHCCEDCGLFVAQRNLCAHEWPTEEHRRADYEKPTADLLFCKEFELA
ncbi:MAG TPA: hypothetical protein PKI49_06760 [Pseudomonadota bacterium]|jgi:hypothetical protein|nr:hypothetical protein [Pseudomonadota bacterium]HND11007.1 hypothetical protein [Pseudomonadota bacterium]HNF98559.1 hypothetical protein [Pseudomonadota bacterium]HNI61065.1 hypothetical protein [Pseudomonadota bacterium]HNK44087.1 hypothetical protein [Pseudomonadota bacterium]